MRGDIGGLQQSVASELKGVSTEVTHQLHEGMKLIQNAQTTMGDRLDRAAQVVAEVQGSLGKLGEATLRVVEVGKDIQGLEQILKSPKVRGGLGETLLAELLSQMLPQEHYAIQHPFKSRLRSADHGPERAVGLKSIFAGNFFPKGFKAGGGELDCLESSGRKRSGLRHGERVLEPAGHIPH